MFQRDLRKLKRRLCNSWDYILQHEHPRTVVYLEKCHKKLKIFGVNLYCYFCERSAVVTYRNTYYSALTWFLLLCLSLLYTSVTKENFKMLYWHWKTLWKAFIHYKITWIKYSDNLKTNSRTKNGKLKGSQFKKTFKFVEL